MDAELQCIRDAGNSKKSVVYDYWDRDRSRFFVFADCRRSIGKFDYVSVPESDFLNAGKIVFHILLLIPVNGFLCSIYFCRGAPPGGLSCFYGAIHLLYVAKIL